MYTKSLIDGNNIFGIEMRAATIRGYLDAVNDLFRAKDCTLPIDFDQLKTNPSAIFYDQIKTWEEEPNRRTHMTPEFLHELLTRANAEQDQDSFIPVVRDWTAMARYAAFRMCEVGQKNQKDIGYHTVPVTNRRIMKAFARGDFQFFDKIGQRITDVQNNAHRIHTIRITWRVQKNRRNGQQITWEVDLANPAICIVKAAIRIYLRSIRFDPEGNRPLGFYVEKGKIKYLTGRKVSAFFKVIAVHVYPDITPPS